MAEEAAERTMTGWHALDKQKLRRKENACKKLVDTYRKYITQLWFNMYARLSLAMLSYEILVVGK